MDVGLFDFESAMRQRYLEIDEKTDEAKELLGRRGWTWNEFLDMYDTSWIYHENGLEGVVLTYPEIKSAIDNKIISDVSLLPTYKDIKNQKTCIDLIREKAANKRFLVTFGFLEELHGLLLGDAEAAGSFRRDIPIHRTYFHEIAQPAKIQVALNKVIDGMKVKEKEQHVIEFAANVHHRFMRVFPFSQHSGAIGRLLCNFVLVRGEYLPVIIHASDRQRYYESLRGPERDFRQFMVEAMDNSLENAIRFLAQNRGTSRRSLAQ